MWQTLRKNEVLKDLGTNEKEGLSEEEVKLRQEKNGKNKLQEKKKESIVIKFLGCLILICIGIYICFQALKKEKDSKNIFNSPISSDLNHSKIIEPQEALILAIALSLDSFCIGISGSMADIILSLFPFLVSAFQLIFLSLGSYLGIHIRNFCKLPSNIWSIISGLLLIFIGFLRFIAF